MASTKIKYLDTNGNEVLKETSVVAAFNDSIVLEFGEVEGENKIVQVVYDTTTGTYQAVPEGSEKGSKWYESKDKLVKILRDQLPIEEYKETPEIINITIAREDKKIGHPLALREANYLGIKGNYEKALATLRAPKADDIVVELPKEETMAQETPSIHVMPEVAATPIVDNQANMIIDTSKMEDIKNEPIDVTNMIFTPREEEKNVTPVIEDVSKNEPILETPVSMPEPIPVSDPTSVPEVTPSIIPTTKNEEPSKIMEAIETPNEMLHEVNNMPPIVDAPNDKIVNFSGATSGNVNVNNEVQEPIIEESKVENSAVEASYMDSFDKAIAQMKQATEKMKSAYEMMESAMRLVTETSENVKNVSHANFQEIQGMNAISRQTFENAQRMMASQDNTEEQSLKRTA